MKGLLHKTREIGRNGLAKHELGPLLGASLLSAVGSLPHHLMPLIVVALIAESRTSIAEAGWVASAVLSGQLLASLMLPVLKVEHVHRRMTIAVSIVLISGLLVTVLEGLPLLLFGWGLVGACCGVLLYTGTTTASAHSRPVFAFSLRLGVVLMLAGTAAGALQATNVLVAYRSILMALCVIFSLVLAAGIGLYRPSGSRAKPPVGVKTRGWSFAQLLGLGTVYLLFVGQTGFLAYAVQGAVGRGMALADAAWAVAGMKIIAGVCLLSIAHRGLQDKQRPRFLELGLLLAASILAISYAQAPLMFFLGLLGFEIGLNFLSARLQGKVSEVAPQIAGRWLTGTILLGAASGAPLHGGLIGAGAGTYFMYFAILSALIPELWFRLRRISTKVA